MELQCSRDLIHTALTVTGRVKHQSKVPRLTNLSKYLELFEPVSGTIWAYIATLFFRRLSVALVNLQLLTMLDKKVGFMVNDNEVEARGFDEGE